MEAPIQHQQTSEILLSKVDELSRRQERMQTQLHEILLKIAAVIDATIPVDTRM